MVIAHRLCVGSPLLCISSNISIARIFTRNAASTPRIARLPLLPLLPRLPRGFSTCGYHLQRIDVMATPLPSNPALTLLDKIINSVESALHISSSSSSASSSSSSSPASSSHSSSSTSVPSSSSSSSSTSVPSSSTSSSASYLPTSTSDVSWLPIVPVGHTAYSWVGDEADASTTTVAASSSSSSSSAPVASFSSAPSPAASSAPSASSSSSSPAAAPQEKKPKKAAAAPAPAAAAVDPNQPPITRIDIRVGQIVKASRHPDAEKLYIEEIDVGEDKPRTVISGLVPYIPLEVFSTARLCVICNLKPSALRGVTSYGMVLAASNPDRSHVELILPPPDAPVGTRVFPSSLSSSWQSFTPDAQVDPKKKENAWEKVKDFLRVDLQGRATFNGDVLRTEHGECLAPTLKDAVIS